MWVNRLCRLCNSIKFLNIPLIKKIKRKNCIQFSMTSCASKIFSAELNHPPAFLLSLVPIENADEDGVLQPAITSNRSLCGGKPIEENYFHKHNRISCRAHSREKEKHLISSGKFDVTSSNPIMPGISRTRAFFYLFSIIFGN
jgi:hypothetical protein